MCATTGCNQPTSGNSKYCREHKAIARQQWLANIKASSEARQQRDEGLAELFERAHEAGHIAAQAKVPEPMIVYTPADPFSEADKPVFVSDGQGGLLVGGGDNIKTSEPVYTVPDGVCGFAWINIRPGNCPAANYAKKHLNARKDYYGGVSIHIHDYGQSYERKMAYARVYAKVLCEAGINAHANGRLD